MSARTSESSSQPSPTCVVSSPHLPSPPYPLLLPLLPLLFFFPFNALRTLNKSQKAWIVVAASTDAYSFASSSSLFSLPLLPLPTSTPSPSPSSPCPSSSPSEPSSPPSPYFYPLPFPFFPLPFFFPFRALRTLKERQNAWIVVAAFTDV